jgi:predicted RNA-binding protein with PUA-like domain
MACWLLKTEPSTYSFADLQREKKTAWSGVTNALAQKHLRAAAVGDDLLVYHTGGEKAVVGRAKVTKSAYPDPADKAGKRVVIDIAAGPALPNPVPLGQIKDDPRLAAWPLVKIGRLSVVPTSPAEFAAVIELAGRGGR